MEEEDTSNPGNVTANVGAKVGMLWIDVEGTQYWSSNTGNNVNFIQQMVDEGKRQGDIPPYIVPLSVQAMEVVRHLLDEVKPAQRYLLDRKSTRLNSSH